jgi:hypothetical protein
VEADAQPHALSSRPGPLVQAILQFAPMVRALTFPRVHRMTSTPAHHRGRPSDLTPMRGLGLRGGNTSTKTSLSRLTTANNRAAAREQRRYVGSTMS